MKSATQPLSQRTILLSRLTATGWYAEHAVACRLECTLSKSDPACDVGEALIRLARVSRREAPRS